MPSQSSIWMKRVKAIRPLIGCVHCGNEHSAILGNRRLEERGGSRPRPFRRAIRGQGIKVSGVIGSYVNSVVIRNHGRKINLGLAFELPKLLSRWRDRIEPALARRSIE